MKTDQQLTNGCFNAFIKGHPELNAHFGNKDAQLHNSQLGAYAKIGIEFAWQFFKEEMAMQEGHTKDSVILDLNLIMEREFILIPAGDKTIKFKKVE